jgi:RND family efflux transporter MFP subunit
LLESLKVQLSYATIRAPIAGRASMAAVKAGNFVRQADAIPLATIIQVDPVYVTFTVPQRYLPSVRQALAAESATVDVTIPGEAKSAEGQVTMIENTVDATTGMVIIRATMPNKEQLLWPGTLVTTKLTLRTEDAVTVPSTAVQVSQEGSFVFVVKDGVASKRAVTVARIYGAESVIETGLQNGETVVTEGQLRLSNGSRVSTREPKAGT